jgi:aerobic-type carbon monoxide dehydrogenase small subunit (CoxS/CutS family)
MSDTRRVVLTVNGEERTLEVFTDETLLDTLRDRLGIFSVRGSCGIGICGTCTVLINGLPISACLSLSALQAGKSVTTSEGLAERAGGLDEVQEAFVGHDAFQCSYCIPAMALTVRAYLDTTDEPTVEGARDVLAGNLCRCGSYPQVLEAIAELVERDRG